MEFLVIRLHVLKPDIYRVFTPLHLFMFGERWEGGILIWLVSINIGACHTNNSLAKDGNKSEIFVSINSNDLVSLCCCIELEAFLPFFQMVYLWFFVDVISELGFFFGWCVPTHYLNVHENKISCLLFQYVSP